MAPAGAETGGKRVVPSRLLRVLLCASLAAAGCAGTPPQPLPEWTQSTSIDGVAVRLTARDPDEARARAALSAAMDEARRVGAQLLREHPGSEIDVLMHVPSHVWIEVSDTTGAALRTAFDVAEATDGAYDPTVPPLLKLWGVDAGGTPNAPRAFKVEMMLRRVDWNDVELEHDVRYQARRRTRRTELDLGALARGAMLDAALASLRSAGVPAGRASTVREHAVYTGETGLGWSIQLLVRGAAGAPARVGNVELSDGALAVASRGPVFVAPDGVGVHDRFDARTGYPAAGVEWVAAKAERAREAGAWADALFALGPDGRAFVEGSDAPPALRAAIQPEAGDVWVSPGLSFQPLD